MIRRQGFTITEALITMVIMSLVMAATMPIVMKSKNAPSEAPFKYVTQGDLAQNAAVYSALGNTATVLLGDKRIPIDSNISTEKDYVFATQLNPKLSIVTRNKSYNPLISRHLIDFYEKETNGDNISIGKISFDRFLNLSLGLNALDSIKSSGDDVQVLDYANSSESTNWSEISDVKTATITVKDKDDSETTYNQISGIDTTKSKGIANTAVGQYAMAGDKKFIAKDYPTRNMIGIGNTALGAFSLKDIQTGGLNTAVGIYSLQSMQSSNNNTAIGSYAMNDSVTGTDNTAIGAFAMKKNNGGQQNVVVGSYSLYEGVTSTCNTAIGYRTLSTNTANGNTAVGYTAMARNTTGAFNTVVGMNSMQDGDKAAYNTAVGYNTLVHAKTAKYNTALGQNAMLSDTTGAYNIAVGSQALQNNTTGGGNIVIGTTSLAANTTGNGNIIIGNGLAPSISVSNKLYIGGNITYNNTSQEMTSNYNTDADVLIYGDFTDKTLTFHTDTTNIGNGDSSNTYILGKAYIKLGEDLHQIATVDDIVTYFQNSRDSLGGVISYPASPSVYSDARLKNILGDNTAGLKEIMQIQVKNYTMKRDKKKEVLVGVIAQELQKVFPNSVSEGRDGFLRIRRDEIFYACVNAIKELNNMIQDLIAKVTGLDEKIRILEDRNKINEEKISALERQNKLFEERLAALENKITKQTEKKQNKETLKKDNKQNDTLNEEVKETVTE